MNCNFKDHEPKIRDCNAGKYAGFTRGIIFTSCIFTAVNAYINNFKAVAVTLVMSAFWIALEERAEKYD